MAFNMVNGEAPPPVAIQVGETLIGYPCGRASHFHSVWGSSRLILRVEKLLVAHQCGAQCKVAPLPYLPSVGNIPMGTQCGKHRPGYPIWESSQLLLSMGKPPMAIQVGKLPVNTQGKEAPHCHQHQGSFLVQQAGKRPARERPSVHPGKEKAPCCSPTGGKPPGTDRYRVSSARGCAHASEYIEVVASHLLAFPYSGGACHKC